MNDHTTTEADGMTPEEELCRIICIAEGVDPDRKSIGCGGLIERDKPFILWEARRRVARAILRWIEDNAKTGGSPPPNTKTGAILFYDCQSKPIQIGEAARDPQLTEHITFYIPD